MQQNDEELMKTRGILTAFLLLAPAGGAFAASKEIQELQRDVALMQEDIRTLQRSFDQQVAGLRTLTQQAVDNSNRTATSLGILERVINDQISKGVGQMAGPVAGLGSKVDQTNGQLQTLADAIQSLNANMQRMQTQLTDLNNAVKSMQPSAAPPPPATSGDPTAGAAGAPGSLGAPTGPPPAPADVLYEGAKRDLDGGKFDLALDEFRNFVRYYPNESLAANALFYIGMIHYGRNQFDDSVKDFDSVLERGPANNNKRPDAFYYKGMSLVKMGRSKEARSEFNSVIQQYPRTDAAAKSRTQLKSLGFSVPAAAHK
jgi:tol-pal system protein YbgF